MPSALTPHAFPLSPPSPAGYLIAQDRYFKRDDVGIVYQINVVPEMRRSLVAAALLKAQFDRSAYGCRLYCCWCAQDIEANRFWEAMGFVPLAYRVGGTKKGGGLRGEGRVKADVRSDLPPSPSRLSPSPRIHIFWQKRIRPDDTTTPWWYPAKTDAGALRADRIVLPIPPGTHWSEVEPFVLPDAEGARLIEETKAPPAARRVDRTKPVEKPSSRPALSGGMSFAPPTPVAPPKPEKAKRPPQPKTKADPRFVSAARELRDRYLDEVNAGRHVLEPTSAKYALARENASAQSPVLPLLEAA